MYEFGGVLISVSFALSHSHSLRCPARAHEDGGKNEKGHVDLGFSSSFKETST